MGVVESLRYCFTSDNRTATTTCWHQTISNDFQYFERQLWYRFQNPQLIDPNKFIFLYNDYEKTQKALLQLWAIVDFNVIKNAEPVARDSLLSDRWKYAIRKGVPVVYCRTIIEQLFRWDRRLVDSQAKYNLLVCQSGKDLDLHQERIQRKWDESPTSHLFLTPVGQEALARILFLISLHEGRLKENAYLERFVSLLLIFMSEAEAYEIVCYLVSSSFNSSGEIEQTFKWHFTLNASQFDKFSAEFYKRVKLLSPTVAIINNHFNAQGVEKTLIFKEIIGHFFFGYLPFPVILKILLQFMNEGAEVLYRFYYAILKCSAVAIRDCISIKQILRIIKSKMLNYLLDTENSRTFFRYAFDLQLYNCSASPTLHFGKHQQERHYQSLYAYYLPTVFGANVEIIWGYLPRPIRHYDLRKIYPKDDGNCSLMGLVKSVQTINFTLIIIECLNGESFGVFIPETIKMCSGSSKQGGTPLIKKVIVEGNETSQLISHPGPQFEDYFGTSDTFVFTVSPERKKYTVTGENIFYCSYSNNNLCIGGPTPALQLEESLAIGLSFPCATYGNTPLHGGPPGEFKINKIECFSIE